MSSPHSDLTIGSLFSGYGGLDMAVEAVTGARPAWFCEWDEAPSKILAHHWPGVPNHRDVTQINWAQVEPVDILTGGSPCQDLSSAGKRAGMTEGTRSNLWVNMREAINHLRPKLVVWENVQGALSAPATSDSDMEPATGLLGNNGGGHLRALGRVLGDLTEIGYDAEWTTLRASDIGAPHHRARIFLIAWPRTTDPACDGQPRKYDSSSRQETRRSWIRDATGGAGSPTVTDPESRRRDHGQTQNNRQAYREINPPHNHHHAATNPDSDGPQTGQQPLPSGPEITGHNHSLSSFPDTERGGRNRGWVRPISQEKRGTTSDTAGCHNRTVEWGKYAPAVRNGEMSHAEECEAGSDAVLGESGENRNLLELDSGESFEVRPREIHGERPGNRPVEEQESPQVGVRTPGGTDTGRVDDRSPMPEPQVCEPGTFRAGDSGGECSAPGGGGDSLPTGASTERRKSVRGEADGAPPMRHLQETPRTDEQTPSHETNWGRYAPAVRRWERTLGTPAPNPTEPNTKGNPRLNAAFAEWMMGLPAGWVTSPDIGLTRAQQLKAIGNGVCPQQAEVAIRHLLQSAE